jgi:hypothetical protein
VTSALCDCADVFATAVRADRPVESCLHWSRRLRLGDTPEANIDGLRRPVAFHPDPAQQAILDAIDGGWTRIAIAGPLQSGKTLAGVNIPVAWCLSELRQPCLIAGPRVDEAAMAWRDKTRPLLVDSGFDWVLPDEGSGSKAGTPDCITASTGARLYLRSGGGANEAGQSAVTVRLAVVTEVDSIALSARRTRRAPGEGDPGRRKIDLFEGRIAAYGHAGRLILESTVKLDHGSLILDLVDEGTGGRLYHPCPHCGAWYLRESDQLRYDDTSAETASATATIVCPINGCIIDAESAAESARTAVVAHRGQVVEAGRVSGPMPPSATWSIRYTSLDVWRRPLGWLAAREWSAKRALETRGDHEPMRQYVRDHQVRGYQSTDHDDRRLRIQPIAVASRSACGTHARRAAPWRGLATIGVDMQERELWWMALVSTGDRAAVIDYGVEYFCHRHEQPTPAQRRAALDRVASLAQAGWELPDGNVMHCAGRIVDLGGRGWLGDLESWMRDGRWSWWGARGDSKRDTHVGPDGNAIHRLAGWYDRFDRPDGRRMLLCSSDIKRRILGGLMAAIDSPVALLIPTGVSPSDHLARQLTAEKCDPTADGRLVWSAVYHHNHLLDCGVYAWALARYLADHNHHTATGQTAAPIAWVGGRR